MEKYIYAIYEVFETDNEDMHWKVDMCPVKRFTVKRKAVEFCRTNLGKYMIAVEKCYAEIFNQIKKGENNVLQKER